MLELSKEYIVRTLEEERLWKEGEEDTFKYGNWKITLRKEEKIYLPFTFSIYGEKDNSCETWSRRYKSMEEAILHILNNFNENVNIKNKYKTILDYNWINALKPL